MFRAHPRYIDTQVPVNEKPLVLALLARDLRDENIIVGYVAMQDMLEPIGCFVSWRHKSAMTRLANNRWLTFDRIT